MKRPMPAAMACLRLCGIASRISSRTRRNVSRKKATPETNTAASTTCHGTPIPTTTDEEEEVLPHRRRHGDRVVGEEAHDPGGDAGREAGGDHHGAEVHPGLRQHRRVDEDDVRHRHERGRAAQNLGPDGRPVLAQPEEPLEHGRHPPCQDLGAPERPVDFPRGRADPTLEADRFPRGPARPRRNASRRGRTRRASRDPCQAARPPRRSRPGSPPWRTPCPSSASGRKTP